MRDEISSPRYSSIGGTSSENDPKFARAMVLHPETVGHAALSLDAVLECHALQVALPVVGPGVIEAAEVLLALAVVVQTDQCAAMRAAVLEGVDLAIGVAGDDHRRVAHLRGAEIAGLRNLHFKRKVMPARSPEDELLFRRVGRFGLEHPVGHACQPFPRPGLPSVRDLLMLRHDRTPLLAGSVDFRNPKCSVIEHIALIRTDLTVSK